MSPKRTPAHIRNLAVALLVTLAIVAVSGAWQPPAQAQAQAEFIPITQEAATLPGQSVPLNFTLFNRTGDNRTFNLTSNVNLQSGVTGTVTITFASTSYFINANSSTQVTLLVTFSNNLPTGTAIGTASISASSSTPNTVSAGAVITLRTLGSAPTATPEPTATTGPSPTPQPVCIDGRDTNDAGGDRGSATLILVNQTYDHGICRQGDEDWFQFGAVGGKVYTIDIVRMDFGLDLQLELYDEAGNLLTSNDDFFARTPPPAVGTATPGPSGDVRPRIQSWMAPTSAFFYIRVRDNLNLGGENTQYSITVTAESNGPTPALVPEICRDMFEEDGLPEEARLITSNETQREKRICPTGDADWVKFFGKQGKTYYLYTDTRPYANNPDINNQTQAGADTTLFLADRDGVTIIAANDDLAGGGSLDSEIRFTPIADGFYYAQVKNTGDIGNQFIRYDLTLKLCVPGEECGRSPVLQPVGPTPRSDIEPTAAFQLSPTPTETPSDEDLDTFNYTPGMVVNGPTSSFVHPAFRDVWQRTDRAVVERGVRRSWMWGPRGGIARGETYSQTPGGVRQVQYFDKGRMELTNPQADRTSQWYVTSGLLVVELITGRMQVGDTSFVQREPADVVIAGDFDDPSAPRYTSFGGVTGQLADDRTGQVVMETIDRTGQVGSYGGPRRAEARLARYIPESRHNIPQVFWDYLNARDTIYRDGGYQTGQLLDWVFTMGYPISEPFWSRVRVGGVERDVLVQVFERRVLTFSPDNPAGWRVEQGNVGRHYYFWRYGEQLP